MSDLVANPEGRISHDVPHSVSDQVGKFFSVIPCTAGKKSTFSKYLAWITSMHSVLY